MNIKPPTISVIIPTYNRAFLIERAIRSVLEQTYKDFEVIVINDGSTDNTEEILQNINDGRIRIIKHTIKKGGGAARNAGIKVAKGTYIAFQDSDDEWLPQKLEKQVRIMETSLPEVGVVYTDMLRVSENGLTKYLHSPNITSRDVIDKVKCDYPVLGIGIQSTLIRKECFERAGSFDETLPKFIDLDLFTRLSKYYIFKHIEEPLVKYYTTAGISSDANASVEAQNLLFKKYYEEIHNNKRFLAKWYFRMGYDLYKDKQTNRGKTYFMKALKTYPLNTKYLGAVLVSQMGQSTFDMTVRKYHKIRGLFIK